MQVTIDQLVKEFETRLNGATFVTVTAETDLELNKYTTGKGKHKGGNLNPFYGRIRKHQRLNGQMGMDHQAWLNRMAELNGVEGRESHERRNGVAWGAKHAFIAPFLTPDVPNKVRFRGLSKPQDVRYFLADTGETIEIDAFAEWLPPPPKPKEFEQGKNWDERDFLLVNIRTLTAFGETFELVPEMPEVAAEVVAPAAVPVNA